MAIKNVLLAGANGGLGQHILPELLKASFNVTVLTRVGSKTTGALPSHVKAAPVSSGYTVEELIPIVRGQDAVVSALGGEALMTGAQSRLVEAAKAAGGIQLFIPGEFGSGAAPEWDDKLAVFGLKKKLRDEVAASGLPWTAIANAAFFEWGLDFKFLHIDIPNRKAMVLDGGDGKFPTTRMAAIGQACVGALKNPGAVLNRMARVQSFTASPNEIIHALEKEMGVKFEVESRDSKTFMEENLKKANAGDMGGMYEVIFAYGALDTTYAQRGEHGLDNKALGVPEEKVEDAVREYVKSKAA